jgi:hypothetical protein
MNTVQNAKHLLLQGLDQALGEMAAVGRLPQLTTLGPLGYRAPAEHAAACRYTHTTCEIN